MKAKQIISEMAAKKPAVRKPQAVQPQGLGPVIKLDNVNFDGEVTNNANETQARRAMLQRINAEMQEILGDHAGHVKITLTYMDYDFDRHDETYSHMFQINVKGPALLVKKLAGQADFMGQTRPEDIDYDVEIETEDKRFPFKTKHGKLALSRFRQQPHFQDLRAAYDELYTNHKAEVAKLKWTGNDLPLRKFIRKTISPLVAATDILQWGDLEDDLVVAVWDSKDFEKSNKGYPSVEDQLGGV